VTYQVKTVMEQSGVGFGTSGARGLASAMSDKVCYIYTQAFLQYLESTSQIKKGTSIAVAGDFRASTERIMASVLKAIEDAQYIPLNFGKIPTPAVSYLGIQKGIPSLMVTGSHIPEDRNGIKFNHPQGEILKKDEQGIKAQVIEINDNLFNTTGGFMKPIPYKHYPENKQAEELYSKRYTDFFGPQFLAGKSIGFYQHSAVGKHLLPQILKQLGAQVTLLNPSDTFIPVDTEAIREEDVALAKKWITEYKFDSLFSTDGDSDRPLVSNEKGEWLRGDILGILASLYFKADSVSTPVSCNTALEKSQAFPQIYRTQIGSPYVIESMQKAQREGYQVVMGYEANGGFLLQTSLKNQNSELAPLPTRDTLLPFLGILGLAKQKSLTLSELEKSLPPRYTLSGRLKNFPTQTSRALIASLVTQNHSVDKLSIQSFFQNKFGPVNHIDNTDGLRVTFASQEVVHLRPSGNAPEFRCYVEADTLIRADEVKTLCLEIMEAKRS